MKCFNEREKFAMVSSQSQKAPTVLTDSVNGSPVRKKAKCVLKYPTSMKERRCKAHQIFHLCLPLTQCRTMWVTYLIIKVIFSKRKYRH